MLALFTDLHKNINSALPRETDRRSPSSGVRKGGAAWTDSLFAGKSDAQSQQTSGGRLLTDRGIVVLLKVLRVVVYVHGRTKAAPLDVYPIVYVAWQTKDQHHDPQQFRSVGARMMGAFNLSPEQLPPQSNFTKVAGSNPTMQAGWYLHNRALVIEHLFGWSVKKGAATDKPGVFGYTRAFFMAEETQARHTLHSHGLLWLVGIPCTTAQWEKCLTNDAWREKFLKFQDRLMSGSYPIAKNPSVKDFPCHHVHPDGTPCASHLVAVDIPAKYRHRVKTDVPPPIVAQPQAPVPQQPHFHTYTSDQLLDHYLKIAINNLADEVQRKLCSDAYINMLSKKTGGLSNIHNVRVIQMTKLLRLNQEHLYHHLASCTKCRSKDKGGGSNVCRYGLPRNFVLMSHIASFEAGAPPASAADMDVDGAPPTGNVLDQGARDIIENHAAIIAAYKALHPRFDAEPDAFSRGHKKLLSLAYHMSANCMEVPETMAALFLHTSAAGIFSHKFSKTERADPTERTEVSSRALAKFET
ncbi:hypothetical protein H9P43_005410 [Blastocladiella emersonii ATCC 22665]|nr:hypothetical protein H9P43_005410 [Blastocladiella emersonii ATCC 22665]